MNGSELLSILGERVIAFPPILVKATGSIGAALFLSQALYWTRIQNGGEFYKTQADWTLETGMSRTEQENARKILVRLGVLACTLRGNPATLHYKVNLDVLSQLLQSSLRETCNQVCAEPAIKFAGNAQTIYKSTTKITSERDRESCLAKPRNLEEVLERCRELELDRDEGEAFWHFYESKGWKVGKVPMVNWHSALSGWKSRAKARGKPFQRKRETMKEQYLRLMESA